MKFQVCGPHYGGKKQGRARGKLTAMPRLLEGIAMLYREGAERAGLRRVMMGRSIRGVISVTMPLRSESVGNDTNDL